MIHVLANHIPGEEAIALTLATDVNSDEAGKQDSLQIKSFVGQLLLVAIAKKNYCGTTDTILY